MTLTAGAPTSSIPAVNVASVPQRSPLRYPGGKTWLVPHVRHWLGSGCDLLVEPFAGGKRAGSRLYAHNIVDHARIFSVLADTGADFMMTYDCCDEVLELVAAHCFCAVSVEMRNGHNRRARELVITRDRLFA